LKVDLDVYLFEENSSKEILTDEVERETPIYANAPFINQQLKTRSVKKSDSVLSNEFYVGREHGTGAGVGVGAGLQLMPAPSIGTVQA